MFLRLLTESTRSIPKQRLWEWEFRLEGMSKLRNNYYNNICILLFTYCHLNCFLSVSLTLSLPFTHSMILTQYCHQLGKACDLKAVISISACLNPFLTGESVENRFINRHIYTKFLIQQLTGIIKQYVHPINII